MKSLVTGAAGFMGSSVVRELLGDGIETKVLVRENSDTRNIDGLDVEKMIGDIRDSESMKASLKGCDTLYQIAALYANWVPNNKAFYDINVEGTKTSLNAALEQGIEKVVYTSSIAAVGSSGIDKQANEETEYNLWGTGSHYCRSKYLGELEAKKFYEKGLPVVIVNPAGVIGVRDIKPTPSGQMILNIIHGEYPGYINIGMNFIDVEDVARGHILAAQKGRIGERYILGNENMSVKDFFTLVGDIAGVEPPKRAVPYLLALTMAYGYQLLSAITRKPPILTPSYIRTTGLNWCYDCSKAVNELGLPQTPVREAIEKAVNWFRENGYLKEE